MNIDRYPIFTEKEIEFYIKNRYINSIAINKAILSVFKIKPKNKAYFTNIYQKDILFTEELIKEITFNANKNIVISILKYMDYGDRMTNIDTYLVIEDLLSKVPDQKREWTLQIIDGYCYLELERIYKKSRQYIKKQVDEVIDNITFNLMSNDSY